MQVVQVAERTSRFKYLLAKSHLSELNNLSPRGQYQIQSGDNKDKDKFQVTDYCKQE